MLMNQNLDTLGVVAYGRLDCNNEIITLKYMFTVHGILH